MLIEPVLAHPPEVSVVLVPGVKRLQVPVQCPDWQVEPAPTLQFALLAQVPTPLQVRSEVAPSR